ncbi:hypothetical protein BDF19DRAFT_80286 [Syncephalis fuscata]|nr:hypothetical protein BDF19DRAFT_80286 [Syncephalis fuscata]
MDIDIDLLERELDAELLEEGEEELVDVTTLTPITTSNSTETEEIDVDSLEESRETVDKTSIVTTSKNEDMIDVTVNESDTETVPIVKEIKLDIELEAKEESAMLSNTMDIEPELVINSKAEIPLSTITMTDDAEEQATIKLEEMPTINSLNGIDSSTSDTTTATKTIGGTKKNKAKRCYCSRERQSALRPMIICHQCQTRFHVDCIPVTHRYWKAIVPGDNFFYFICSDCGGGAGREVFQRVQLTWIEVVHLALFTLSHMSPWKERDPMEDGRVYFATKQDICALIRSRWEQFWLIDLTPIESWEEQVISALKTGCTEERFVSGEAMFGRTALREPAYNIISSGKLVSLLDEDTQVKVKVLEETPVLDTDRSRKRSDSDDTANKTELTTKYKRMKAESKATKSSSTSSVELSETIAMYPDLDNPGGPVRLSRQPTHTASRVFVSEDGMTTSNEKGYRMAKASHSVFEGAWYYEARFEGDANSNARIGWSQISGDLQGPCGFDYFSYGYRARPGTVFHQSVGRFMGGKGYAEPGDVLGVLLYIPSLNEAEKSDLEGRRWQFGADYEHFRYARPKAVYSPGGIGEGGEQQQQQQHIINQQTISVPDTQLIGESVMPRVQGSELRYYVNGELAGIAFTNIFLDITQLFHAI